MPGKRKRPEGWYDPGEGTSRGPAKRRRTEWEVQRYLFNQRAKLVITEEAETASASPKKRVVRAEAPVPARPLSNIKETYRYNEKSIPKLWKTAFVLMNTNDIPEDLTPTGCVVVNKGSPRKTNRPVEEEGGEEDEERMDDSDGNPTGSPRKTNRPVEEEGGEEDEERMDDSDGDPSLSTGNNDDDSSSDNDSIDDDDERVFYGPPTKREALGLRTRLGPTIEYFPQPKPRRVLRQRVYVILFGVYYQDTPFNRLHERVGLPMYSKIVHRN